jgi:hypothetical protein
MGTDTAPVSQAIRAVVRVRVAREAGAGRRREPAVENSETPDAVVAVSCRLDAPPEEPVVPRAEQEAVPQLSRSDLPRRQHQDA